MAILQRAPNLPREFSCDPFPKSSMRDDIVEHLSSAHILGDHVVVVLVDDHLAHAADVGVVE